MNNKYLKNVATLTLDSSKCKGCEMCTQVCPHQIFFMKDGIAEISDRDRCMECGACAKNCPFSAISVKAGVGCAYAVIKGALTGSEPTCGCGGSDGCC